MGRVVYLGSIPDCDFCLKEEPPRQTPAIVDGPTVSGSHAYMCNHHRKRWALDGVSPAGTHPLENPIALRKPKPIPSDEERDKAIAEFVENADMDEMTAMFFDQVSMEAVDGCPVEIDGMCEHGYPSKLAAMGVC